MTAAAAAAPMQGTYIPQYTPVPPTAVPVEVRASNTHTLLMMKNNLSDYPKENIITPDNPITHTHRLPIQPFFNLLSTSTHQNIH